MKHPIFRLKKAYVIGFTMIILSIILEQIVSQYALYIQKQEEHFVTLAGKERALQQELAREALLMVHTNKESAFAQHQRFLIEKIPVWKQSYLALQHGDIEESNIGLNHSQDIQYFFEQAQPHFDQMLAIMEKLALASFDHPENHSLVNQMLYQEISFFHYLNITLESYEKESEEKYIQLRATELFFFGVTLAVVILQIVFLFRPALVFIRRTFHLLKLKEEELLKSEEKSIKRYEELELKKKELNQTNENLLKANEELEEMHLHERENRMVAELARKQAQKHKEDFHLSYQELKATEQELRHYAEELEQLNDRLADANVTAAELQVELEDSLKREKNRIAELENAYRELKQTQSKLVHAEKMASLGQLVEGIAHELNNPMNFVSGGAQGMLIILEDIEGLLELLKEINQIKNHAGEYGEQLQKLADAYNELDWEATKLDLIELADNIKTGVKRSSAIVQSLHSFARASSDSYGLLHISSSIDDIWNILGDKQTKGIQLIRNHDQVPLIGCNARGIHQVLMHIFKNAIDAIQEANEDGTGVIKTNIRESEEKVYVDIIDNGIGVPKDVEAKMFEPFFTTKEVGKGMGLGLSISYTILEEQNGTIEFSREGDWTKFTISLPVNTPEGPH